MGLPQANIMSYGPSAEVEQRLEKSMGDVSRSESLTHNVLSLIVHQSYEAAENEVQLYIDLKHDFPEFPSLVERYVEHCSDLIHAIKTKRSLPGLESLSMSKRQEIFDSVLFHFNELKDTLKRIEKTEYSVRITDLRSTTIFVKTFWWCVLAIISLALILDVYHGLYSTTGAVVDDFINTVVDKVFDAINL